MSALIPQELNKREAFKEVVYDTLREGYLGRLATFLELVAVSDDPEIHRKALEFENRVLGLGVEKNADPYAGLATVNIVFENGGAVQLDIDSAAATEPVPANVAPRVSRNKEITDVEPLEASVAPLEFEDDTAPPPDLLAEIDALLERRGA